MKNIQNRISGDMKQVLENNKNDIKVALTLDKYSTKYIKCKNYIMDSCRIDFLDTVGIVFCYLLHSFYPGIFIFISSYFIDTVVDYSNRKVSLEKVKIAFLYLLLFMGIQYLFKTLQKFLEIRYEEQCSQVVKLQVLRKQERLPYAVLEKKRTQELIHRISKEPEDKIKNGFLNYLDVLNYGIQTISIVTILFIKMPLIAGIVLVISIPILWLSLKCGEWDYKANKEATDALRKADYYSKIITSKEQMEEREVFQSTQFLDDQWTSELNIAMKYLRRANNKGIFHFKVSSILSILVQGIMMIFLLIAVKNGNISIGIGISVLKSENDLITKITWELTDTLRNFKSLSQYRKELQQYFQLPEEKTDSTCENIISTVDSVYFDHVSFAYPETDKLILNDFSMKFERGKKYAIVGMNGAGKTTILKLLAGMYTNYSGEIRINTIPISQLSRKSLHACLSIMFQDFAKYQITFEENVRIGDLNQEKDIGNLLTKVRLDGKVQKLKSKEKTFLGKLYEGGENLSGGEWQKVAAARCLYRDAPVYIMDEPTSAMDSIGEQAIADFLSQLESDKIVITITHRLGIARDADCILVLKDGRIEEEGYHYQLLKRKGIYYQMYETQRSWYND